MVAYRRSKHDTVFIGRWFYEYFCNRVRYRFQLLLFGFSPRSAIGYWLALLRQMAEDLFGVSLQYRQGALLCHTALHENMRIKDVLGVLADGVADRFSLPYRLLFFKPIIKGIERSVVEDTCLPHDMTLHAERKLVKAADRRGDAGYLYPFNRDPLALQRLLYRIGELCAPFKCAIGTLKEPAVNRPCPFHSSDR